jgi:3-oxoacyl-[acyl-carrier protein] reductase
MDLNLSGKRALVCGSTQGMGRASAVELANLGASVTLLARDESKLNQVLASLPRPKPEQSHGVLVADFSKPDEVRRVVQGAVSGGQGFQILINNTGGPPAGPMIDAKPEDLLTAFNAQLITSHILVQTVVPGMKAAKYGRIINITSTSVKQPIPNLGISNAVRAAVANWAKTLSQELGPFGITVNNILPGYTRTDRLASLLGGRAQKQSVPLEKIEQDLMGTIPAGRFGTPEEIAAAVAFLTSPAAAYISGINLPVDGGRLACL